MDVRSASNRLVVKGLVAGLLGGVVGSGAKLIGEAIYPPRTQGQEPPPAVLAEKLAGHPLSAQQKTLATQAFHWTTGAGIGAAYGAVAEVFPVVTIGYGLAFGMAVLLGTHETLLPLLGLDKPPTQQPLREHSSEVLTHGFYGFSVEAVRRWLMRRWRAAALGKREVAEV